MTNTESAAIFKALSNPDRVAIMDYLATQGEMSVHDVAEHIKRSQTHTTQHLIRMRKAGLINRRQDKQTVFNSIADGVVWPIVLRSK